MGNRLGLPFFVADDNVSTTGRGGPSRSTPEAPPPSPSTSTPATAHPVPTGAVDLTSYARELRNSAAEPARRAAMAGRVPRSASRCRCRAGSIRRRRRPATGGRTTKYRPSSPPATPRRASSQRSARSPGTAPQIAMPGWACRIPSTSHRAPVTAADIQLRLPADRSADRATCRQPEETTPARGCGISVPHPEIYTWAEQRCNS